MRVILPVRNGVHPGGRNFLLNTLNYMAKSKKKASPKAIKKNTAKAASRKPVKAIKKISKPVKKTALKKIKTTSKAVKKTIAKKIILKKENKQVAKPIKKAAPKQAKVVAVKSPIKIASNTQSSNPLKAAPSALNIFPNAPQQRPIAHRPIGKSIQTTTDNRIKYSEDELKEFEVLIHQKLDKARSEYKILKDTLNRNNDEGTDATSGGNTKVLEDGAETAEKENMSQLAARQQKYIMNLENALVRIKNGTYGICSVTGKLISKERLYAVPHTTQSIEAKMKQQD
jgi:RNA polymerase-binding transcription factor DksA